MKAKIKYVCENCGNITVQWSGKCFECQSWNSFREEMKSEQFQRVEKIDLHKKTPQKTKDIKSDQSERFYSGISELDKVLGGGIVPGSVILLGGAPGVGKSTLLVELCGKSEKIILYVSGEESEAQVAQRFQRLGASSSEALIYHESNIDNIKAQLEILKPDILILDSIQTTYSQELNSLPGSSSQLRDVTFEIVNYSKTNDVTSFIIGHVTKEGSIAGPRILEHMVDTVVYFEGDCSGIFRMLRVIKNRFGSTDEIGMFEMNSKGLEEVKNPSKYFLEENSQRLPGRALSCILEGNRVLFTELQVLVTDSSRGQGRRTTQGLDMNRLVMLVALLEKVLKIEVEFNDIYLNVIGGLRFNNADTDLCVLAGLLSSIKAIPLSSTTLFLGEASLTGELRKVRSLNKKLKEAENLGFEKVVIPKNMVSESLNQFKVEIYGLEKISELEDLLKNL